MSIIQEALKKAQTTYTYKRDLPKEEILPKKETAIPEKVIEKILPNRPVAGRTPLIKLIPAIILLIIFIGVGFRSFISGDRELRKTNSAPAIKDIAPKIEPKDVSEPIIGKSLSSIALARAPDFVLNGIMYLQERPRAIINGNVIGLGESVSGARIDAINKDNVVLNYNGAEITLRLKD